MKAYTTLMMIAMLAIAANAVTKNSSSASLKGDGEMKDGPKGDSHAKKEAAPCKDECEGKEWCKDDCMECWEENGACPTKCNACYPRCAFCLHDARMAMEEAMEEKKGTKGGPSDNDGSEGKDGDKDGDHEHKDGDKDGDHEHKDGDKDGEHKDGEHKDHDHKEHKGDDHKGGAGGAQTAFVKTSGVDAQARLDRVAANMQRRHQEMNEVHEMADKQRQICQGKCELDGFSCEKECDKKCDECRIDHKTGEAKCPKDSDCPMQCQMKCGDCAECHFQIHQEVNMKMDSCFQDCQTNDHYDGENFDCGKDCGGCSECDLFDGFFRKDCSVEQCSYECRGRCGMCHTCKQKQQFRQQKEMDPCFEECHIEHHGFSCYEDCNDCYNQQGCFDGQKCDQMCNHENKHGCNHCHECHAQISRLQDPCFDECDQGWCYENCMSCKDDPKNCKDERCVKRCTDCLHCHSKHQEEHQKNPNNCPHEQLEDGRCVLHPGDGDCRHSNNVCGMDGKCNQESGECRVDPPCFNECDQGWCYDNCYACVPDLSNPDHDCTPECVTRCTDCKECFDDFNRKMQAQQQKPQCKGGEQDDGKYLLCEGDSDCAHPNNFCGQGLVCKPDHATKKGVCMSMAPEKK